MRVMTIAATDFPFQHLMMIGKIELAALVEVALETGFGRFARVDDRMIGAARFIVPTARAVTGFTTHVDCVVAFGHQA